MTSLWLNYVFLIINYRERDSSDTNYVRIRIPNHNAKHCKSTLGKRAASNGELYIEFAENWCTHRDVWHEMFHTIGLFHEHQRSDRDEYVKFNQINLQDPSRLNNFITLKVYKPVWPYDITSILHYQHDQGAKTGLSSLEPLDNKALNRPST